MASHIPFEPSDDELMAALVKRESEALASLYDRYSALVYGLSLRILCDRDDAEGVVTDVFIELWDKPNRFDPQRGSLRTYLATLARSRSIDRLRALSARTARERRLQHENSDAGSTTSHDDPSVAAIRRERAGLLASALADLSQIQQKALRLVYFEGRTHVEIAAQLEMPLGTVKTAIRQGLIKLRSALGRME